MISLVSCGVNPYANGILKVTKYNFFNCVGIIYGEACKPGYTITQPLFMICYGIIHI